MHQLFSPNRWLRAALDWLCGGRADYEAFRSRRRSRQYRTRKRWCKHLWIGAGGLMILEPNLAFVLVVALTTTFLSFALLDENDS